MMDVFDPRQYFPDFYTNPAIVTLSPVCRWTISGQIGDSESSRKVPIDVRHLCEGCSAACRHEGPVRGAWQTDETCLMTLDELTSFIPTASNAAFYLDATVDGYVVLDIEPSCPPDISRNLLSLPGIVYSEVSLSGQGYHCVIPSPPSLLTFPSWSSKPALRHAHGWFEMLLHHWVTFTRQPLSTTTLVYPSLSGQFASIDDVYTELMAMTAPSPVSSDLPVDRVQPRILHAADIIAHTCTDARPALRSLDDFDQDHSRWEFSILSTLYYAMRPWLTVYQASGCSYSFSDHVWLLYQAATQVIPWRPKHNTRRGNQPYLLSQAATLISRHYPLSPERSTHGVH